MNYTDVQKIDAGIKKLLQIDDRELNNTEVLRNKNFDRNTKQSLLINESQTTKQTKNK
jgi:hypothetical protein